MEDHSRLVELDILDINDEVKQMKRKNKNTEGTVIIETSIVLPLFILMTLFLYGLFSITSAQNQITHALIQSSKSISLDPYLMEHVNSLSEADTFWGSLGDIILDFARLSNDQHFSSNGSWYTGTGDATIAKDRFVGYFTGGDEVLADQKLEELGVVNGLDGMNFQMTINGEDITVTIKYELQFIFDAFDMGKIPMEQTITTRMWM